MLTTKPYLRFNTNKTETNVLMTQIRGEKKNHHRCEPIFTPQERTHQSKRIYKENLAQTTILYQIDTSLSPR